MSTLVKVMGVEEPVEGTFLQVISLLVPIRKIQIRPTNLEIRCPSDSAQKTSWLKSAAASLMQGTTFKQKGPENMAKISFSSIHVYHV